MSEKQESALKSKLKLHMKTDLVGFVQLSHEDVRTAGIPDWSVTANGRTSWFEFKHATPDFTSSGIQELTMLRLAVAGYARYIMWYESKNGLVKKTLIVHPKNIHNLEPEDWCAGFNFQFITSYMRKIHGNQR